MADLYNSVFINFYSIVEYFFPNDIIEFQTLGDFDYFLNPFRLESSRSEIIFLHKGNDIRIRFPALEGDLKFMWILLSATLQIYPINKKNSS